MEQGKLTISKVGFVDPLSKTYTQEESDGERIVDNDSFRIYSRKMKKANDDNSSECMYRLSLILIDGIKKRGSSFASGRLFTESEVQEITQQIEKGENPEELSGKLSTYDRLTASYQKFLKNVNTLPHIDSLSSLSKLGEIPSCMLFKVPFQTVIDYKSSQKRVNGWLEPGEFKLLVEESKCTTFEDVFLPTRTLVPNDNMKEPITELHLKSVPNTNIIFRDLLNSKIGQVVNIYNSTHKSRGFPYSILVEGKNSEREATVEQIKEFFEAGEIYIPNQ
jgi:hypothetical protein